MRDKGIPELNKRGFMMPDSREVLSLSERKALVDKTMF